MRRALYCIAPTLLVCCGGKVVFSEGNGGSGGANTAGSGSQTVTVSHAASSSTGMAQIHVVAVGHDPVQVVISSESLTCDVSPDWPQHCGWWQENEQYPSGTFVVGPVKSNVTRNFDWTGPQQSPTDPLSCIQMGAIPGQVTIDALDAKSVTVTLQGYKDMMFSGVTLTGVDGTYTGLRCP